MGMICCNCKEPLPDCACMRNVCVHCGAPVGNITFSVCDRCWDLLKSPPRPAKCFISTPTGSEDCFPSSPVKTAQRMFADTHAASDKTKKGEGGL